MVAKALRFVQEAGFDAPNDDSNDVVNEDPTEDLQDANQATDAFQADKETEAPERAEPEALNHVDEDIIDPRLFVPASEEIQMAI